MFDADDEVGVRGKVALSTNWWKLAWPMSKKPKNDGKMLVALKVYQKAKVGKSRGNLKDALVEVDVTLNALLGEADKIKKMKNPLKRKAIKTDLKKAKALVASEIAAVDKSPVKPRVVYSRDFADAVSDAIKDTNIKFSSYNVELKLLEVLAQELDAKNGLALLNNMLNDKFNYTVKLCEKDVRRTIIKADGMMNSASFRALDDTFDRHATGLQKEMREVPIDVFRKMRIHAAIAAKYKKDKAVKITKGAVGVGLGVTGALLPGTLPFALVALARSVASLAKEIVAVLMDLDTKIKVFLSYIGTLAAAYKKHRGAREITLSTLNSILGVDVLPTLNKAKADLKEIEKCVAVFYHRAHKMTKEVMKALDISNELTKRFEKSATDVKAFMKSKKSRKIRKAMKNLDSVLDKTHDLMRQATIGEKQVPILRKKLKDLGENSGSVDKANIIIGQIINLGMAVAGIVDAAAVGQAIESVVVADLSAWMDAVEIGKELAEL